MKQKSVFVCQSCGNDSPKWAGQCSFCGQWNSLVETIVSARRAKTKKQRSKIGRVAPKKLAEVRMGNFVRLKTGIGELDRVLGGGIVPGSVILLAGEPGIGKSTLVLQLAGALAKISARGRLSSGQKNQESRIKKNKTNSLLTTHNSVLYVSGEESLEQIKIRAERLGLGKQDSLFLSETDADIISDQISRIKPRVAIIDSVQTLASEDLSSPAGSVGQIREGTARLIRVAKGSLPIAIILIGHVTKQGVIAGPKVLEHMVDTVITLSGAKLSNFRLLRTAKNRFGATSEVGIFQMTDQGMTEVKNPSAVLIKDRVVKVPGSVIVPVIEGQRPVLVEVQALVVPTQLPMPRRVAQGFDYKRLQFLTAVLSKRLRIPLGNHDVIVNLTGGIKVQDPGLDLGVALAIISSFKNKSLSSQLAVFGEVGLLGELRPVYLAQERVKEARRLGFLRIISPGKFPSLSQVAKSLF
ncbi:DNA repair protein RadA [Patescibacteria group bacterium]